MLCCGGGGGSLVNEGEETKFKVLDERWNIQRDAIGEGGFGTVHLCTSVRHPDRQRACKAMRLPTALDREDFRHEVMILKQVKKHANICHIVDSAEDARYGYLVMQSCTGGELFEKIAARNCNERDSAMAVLDVLSALNYLHGKRILHRDLKPENLLYKDKAPGAPLKLIDFGLAIHLNAGEKATEVCGTTSYMAPEVLQGNYATECDIWSLGVITYFMLSGTLPFPGRNDDEKEDRILRAAQSGINMNGRHWAEVSKEAKDFVKGLLTSNPRKRLAGTRAVSHPWIANRAQLSNQPMSEEVAKSLKKYSEANKFEKAIRHQLATHLTSAELHKLRNIFEKLDSDGTGNVSIDALVKALKEDAVDAKTADMLGAINLQQFDLDGDGQIDWQEFVAGAMQENEVYNEDNLNKVFSKLDTDGNGTLCQREIAAVCGGDHEFSREVLDAVAAARPGQGDLANVVLTLQEFKDVILKGGAKSKSEGARRRRHNDNPAAKTAAPEDQKI